MDTTHVACLFCQSGLESKLVAHIERLGYGKALFPLKKLRHQNKKTHKVEEISVPLLKGYVFLYIEEETQTIWTELAKREELIRVLHYGDEEEPWLVGQDLAFAKWIWNQDGLIEKIAVMQVGDRIKIVDSAFLGMQGEICKVDHRKQTCQIALDTNSMIQHIWLPYEVIEKTDKA